jgi:hypothetical protein
VHALHTSSPTRSPSAAPYCRYYDAEERALSVAAAAIANAGMSRSSLAEQQAAQQWIEAAMARAQPTAADAEALRRQAFSLSCASLQIVGRVLGIGDIDAVEAQLAQLNAHSLMRLQQSLGSMGMEHRPGQ